MFGYLQVQKSELLVREFEAYKSVYCGLCKQIGKEYSFLSRLILSYDCTFYAMLLMSVSRSCSGFKRGRCTFNPFKKCSFAECSSDSLSKASAFSVIAAFYKLRDDLNDSRLFKRLICRCLMPFFSHQRKKAVKKGYEWLDRLFDKMLESQLVAEQNSECDIDLAADPTACLIGEVFSCEAQNESQKRVFYEFGYNIGRWIYLADAADDIDKDTKSGNFNPFVHCARAEDKQYISIALNQTLARAYDAYNLMDIVDFKGILDNMLTKGLPTVQNKIIRFVTEEVNE